MLLTNAILLTVVVYLTVLIEAVTESEWGNALDAYQRIHRNEVVLNEAAAEFCSRKFVVATYACPSMVLIRTILKSILTAHSNSLHHLYTGGEPYPRIS
jgi:hypothetical protein